MQPSRRTTTFHSLEITYLAAEIGSGHNNRAKRALQHLCRAARSGVRVHPGDIAALENQIFAAFVRGSSDEKVRRWSLSALSLIGRRTSSLRIVKQAIQTCQDEPQVMSAAIAALYSLDALGAGSYITNNNYLDPTIAYLSALQSIQAQKVDLEAPTINIESCDSLTLKLSLLLVGMNKSPENLFHPRFTNREIVRELWKSDDSIVAQYSVWAASENPNLTSSDIDIDITDIEARPENQRSYIYRLYGSDPAYSEEKNQVIILGSRDPSNEARLGCAIGILDSWYEGLEQITSSWFFEEPNEETQLSILDHIVRQSQRSEVYSDLAIALFVGFENDKKICDRMIAQAARLPLSNKLRKIEGERSSGLLFPLETPAMTNNFTFNNPSFQGQTSFGEGDNINNGQQSNEAQQDNRSVIAQSLEEARRAVAGLPISSELKEDATEALASAAQSPSKTNLERAMVALETCDKALEKIQGIGDKAKSIAGYVALIGTFLT